MPSPRGWRSFASLGPFLFGAALFYCVVKKDCEMSNVITIAGVAIRQDDLGRYGLNDLHRAAGEEARHKPGNLGARAD